MPRRLLSLTRSGLALVALILALPLLQEAVAQQKRAADRQTGESARAIVAAISSVASGQPILTLSQLIQGHGTSLWEDFPTPDTELLEGVEDRAPVQGESQNLREYQAYTRLLVRAHETPEDVLSKNSRHDVSFIHLFEEPRKYRGQLIHLEGRLRRLLKFDTNRTAAAEGVPVLYEGWLFGDVYNSNPYCVIVSELPAWLSTGDKLEVRVGFDGYFFKRYRYRAGDSWRDAPLLIGRTFTRRPPPVEEPDSPWSFTSMFMPAFLGLLAATVALTVGLSWWFRRGDRRVRTRLDAARGAGFLMPPTQGQPPASP